MTEKEIFEIENTRPHVVILGAGSPRFNNEVQNFRTE